MSPIAEHYRINLFSHSETPQSLVFVISSVCFVTKPPEKSIIPSSKKCRPTCIHMYKRLTTFVNLPRRLLAPAQYLLVQCCHSSVASCKREKVACHTEYPINSIVPPHVFLPTVTTYIQFIATNLEPFPRQ